MRPAPRLDDREEHHRVPAADGLSLFLRRLTPTGAARPSPVLYVHGAPSRRRSRSHRFDGDTMVRSPSRRDVKISRGTHLMHLEAMRPALWQESIAFLNGDDVAVLADTEKSDPCSS